MQAKQSRVVSQMQNLARQIKYLGAEERDMVETTGSFKSKTLNKHSLPLTGGAEKHPHLKWAFQSSCPHCHLQCCNGEISQQVFAVGVF